MTNLNLENNQINKIENNAFFNLSNLETLNLAKNQISELNSFTLIGLKRVTKIMLANNRLTSLSIDVFDDFVNLNHLDLSFNLINDIGESFYKIKLLRILNLTNHSIAKK